MLIARQPGRLTCVFLWDRRAEAWRKATRGQAFTGAFDFESLVEIVAPLPMPADGSTPPLAEELLLAYK